MPLFRSKAEDKVREAGYDPARLPPGQYLTEKWPVLHAGDVPAIELASWQLRIFGLVEEEAIVCYEADGEPLTPEHGGPVRLVVPSRYFWKSAKWLTGLELVASDKP